METCQFSKPPVVHSAGISWQDNERCFMGCWRYSAADYMPPKVTKTFTMLTYCIKRMSQRKAPNEVVDRGQNTQ